MFPLFKMREKNFSVINHSFQVVSNLAVSKELIGMTRKSPPDLVRKKKQSNAMRSIKKFLQWRWIWASNTQS